MTKVKRGLIYIFASMLIVLTCLFFASCGKEDKYKNVSLSVSNQSISLFVGETATVEFKINNIIKNMDNTLNYTIVDSSTSPTSAEHISVKTVSAIDEVIQTEITGLSSGRSTLIATTREGSKQARIDVVVKQYSKKFELDTSKIMYVAKGETLYIGSNYFIFDEGTTEKDVTYYASSDIDDFQGAAKFKYVTYSAELESLVLFDENDAVVQTEAISNDGYVFKFIASYKYKDIDDSGEEVENFINIPVSLIAMKGLDVAKINIYETENLNSKIEDYNDYKIDIVVRRTSSDVKEYFITVPKMQESISLDFGFSFEVTDFSAVNIQSELYNSYVVDAEFKEKLNEENLDLYKITLSSKTSNATTLNMILKVFYTFGDGVDFSQEFNSKVNYVIYLPIEIKLMPEKLEIENSDKNILTSNSAVTGNLNDEIYYNFYAGADYGWNEYFVNVYKTSSTFSGVKVEFDYTKVQIRYAGRLYSDTFIMEDLSLPLYVKGVDGVSVDGEREHIVFTVLSDLFRVGEELKAVLNYQIFDGASKIFYEDAFLQQNGLNIALSSKGETFSGLYAEQLFKSFTLETNTPGIVSLGNFVVENIDDKYYLKFDILPIKTGKANYIVRLDNGVSVPLSIEVVETFDDISVELTGENGDVVLFEKALDEAGNEIENNYNLVIRNSQELREKTANLTFSTSYMKSIKAENLSVEIDDPTVLLVRSADDFTRTLITTIKGGDAVVTVNLTGTIVKDFVKDTETKTITVNVVSFVPVVDIVAYNLDLVSGGSERADNVVVYAKAELEAQNTANLSVEINPTTAYNFYDLSQEKYVSDADASKYVYWTLSDGVYAYPVDNTGERKTTIYQKGSYYISGRATFSKNSYFGIFEYDATSGNYKFIANKDYSSGANFTLYASIRQYGLKKYFPVNISCEKFVSVEKIYLGDNIANYAFKNASEELSFVVYLNPYEATNSGIRLIYEKISGKEEDPLIEVDNEDLVSITKQDTSNSISYIVKIKLSQKMVNDLIGSKESKKGVLYVAPEDWCTSTSGIGAVASDKRNRVVSINIAFQNGSYENPFVLETAEDFAQIVKTPNALQAHYIVYDMIDMSNLPNDYYDDYCKNEDDEVPLPFTGTIRGANENAGFKNIRIFGLPYALFYSVDKNLEEYYNFENLIFEGSLKLTINAAANIGLIAKEFNGTAVNITVSINEKSLIEATGENTSEVNVGSLFGLMTGGEILQDFTRNYILISGSYYSSDHYIKKNGDYEKQELSEITAGTSLYFKYNSNYYLIDNNTIEIEGNKYTLFNVVKNVVYSEESIDVSGTVEHLSIGGIVGKMNGGTIKQIYNPNLRYTNYASYTSYTNILVSKIAGSKIGGIVGKIVGVSTIQGVKAGGRAGIVINDDISITGLNYVGGIVGYINNASTINNNVSRVFVCGFNVGGISGGNLATGINASGNVVQAVDEAQIGFKASLITKLNSSKAARYNILSDETYSTYIKREYVEPSTKDIANNPGDDKYFGDFIVVKPTENGGSIIYGEKFTASTSEDLKVTLTNENRQLTATDGDKTVTFVYFYEAQAYYHDGEFVYTNIGKIQESLNKLNVYAATDVYTSGLKEDLVISTDSDCISIDSLGNITVLKSSNELVKISISSIVNQRESIDLYLYVINYFNVDAYTENHLEELFFLGGNAVTSSVEFSVVSNKALNFALNPKMQDDDKAIQDDMTIVTKENIIIKLASANKFIDFDVTFDKGEDSFGEIEKYEDGFFFEKKVGKETTKDDYDELTIKAYLSATIEGKEYKLDLIDIGNVTANYYEGATHIESNYASYVVVTGEKTRDQVSIKSDITETLCYVITDVTGEVVTEGEISGITASIDTVGLFNVTGSQSENTFDVEIEVNKESYAYKNRFNKNIYGKYYIKYFTSSKDADEVFLNMVIHFEEQDVQTISLASFGNMKGYLEEGNVFESGTVSLKDFGLLSVSLAPVDADFDNITIENDFINYQEGSAPASLVFGVIEGTTFNPVYVAQTISQGISLTKENIIQAYGDSYDGQFFVRYMFSSTKARHENPVKLNVNVYKNDNIIIGKDIELKINKTNQIGISLNGLANKKYIARGLSYELEITGVEQDAQSVEIYVKDAAKDYASIREENGQIYLDVSNTEITSGVSSTETGGKDIEVVIEVKKPNEKGEIETVKEELKLTILNYVINYDYAQDGVNADVISGMENGIISTAVGEATTLSVNFKDYALIEYNTKNTSIREDIKEFISSLDENGNWLVYLDTNDLDVKIYDNPIEDLTKANVKTVGEDINLDNYYFSSTGLTFRTKRTHSPLEGHYVFTYHGAYVIAGGNYEISYDNKDNQIKSQFMFDAFIRGSDENPNPITTYQEFKDMRAGGSYILMNDIRITSEEFAPVSTAIASFDGNGYKFIFSNFGEKENTANMPSTFDCVEMADIGLFSNVAPNTVIKNVTVQIGDENSGDVVFKARTNSSITVGFIAAHVEALGVLTNVAVQNYPGVLVSIEDNQDSGSILGCVVGNNSGFVTHSRSSLSFTSKFSSAGFVGNNNGDIASSYFKGGKIKIDIALSTTNIYTAGFVVNNNGTIRTSYTSKEDGSIKYGQLNWEDQVKEAEMDSTVLTAGFAYKNAENGKIDDCYSNLRLRSSTNASGFIFENEGVCRNCISFSLVNPYSNTQYGFAASSIKENGFENCYYLRDPSKNINTAQDFVNIRGVGHRTVEDFEYDANNDISFDAFKEDQGFTTYNLANEENLNYVWNYLNELGRMELVDANLIAFSQKHLNVENTSYAPDGTPIYDYVTAETSKADGDVTNPYIISNPKKFENIISKGNTSGKYYRIVCDLNYSEYETSFATSYNVTFGGYLYGNGMVIENISLYSDRELEYAGLFAQLKGSAFKSACVKDLTLIPTQISFANTNVVGGICGYASRADIFNVAVLGNNIVEGDDEEENEEDKQEKICVIIGKHIVGGVVGLTQDNYLIDNATVKISILTKHINLNQSDILPTQNESLFIKSYMNKMSYAGGVVGFLGGYGSLQNVNIVKAGVTTIGASAGNVTGIIAKNALVQNVTVKMHANMITRAFVFGGIVSGITYGSIINANIIGTGEDLALFTGVPYMPISLGGVTGYLTGGNNNSDTQNCKISNVYMGQSLLMPYDDGFTTKAPSYVGGIVGEVGRMSSSVALIEKVKVAGNVSTTFILGGAVGIVDANTTLILKEVAVDNVSLKLSGRNDKPVLANFVGLVAGYLKIYNSYSLAHLAIDCFEYEKAIAASIGELVAKTESLATDSLNGARLLEIKNIYTNNTYDVFLVDKSAIDPVVTSSFDDEPVPTGGNATPEQSAYQAAISGKKVDTSAVNGMENVFTAEMLGGFSYRKEESVETITIDVGYYRLMSTTGNENIENFAESLDDYIWHVAKDENQKITQIYLQFENNF